MNNKEKLGLFAIVAAIILAVVYFGGNSPKTGQVYSATGTTFSSAKIAAINMSLSTAAATSTSVYNSDGTDRYITDAFVVCNTVGTSKTAYTGAGLANLTFVMATTTTSAPAVLSNTNYIASMNLATSTTIAMASSTVGDTAASIRLWPTATYVTVSSNATNTAQCTVGVKYIAS